MRSHFNAFAHPILGAVVVLASIGTNISLANDEPPTYEEVCECKEVYSGVREIPVMIRDFKHQHPDFESTVGYDKGIVEFELGLDGRPVYAHGDEGTLTTNGPDAFNQWYRDTPGVNIGIPATLQLTELSPGFWQYASQDFFPIDNQGWGNQDFPRNYHFTLETHMQFFYTEGQTFTFKGDDDLWIFINGKLAIDIGGVHGEETQTVNLDDVADKLGIEPGNTYSFDLFFAERHYVHSRFTFQTTMELECL